MCVCLCVCLCACVHVFVCGACVINAYLVGRGHYRDKICAVYKYTIKSFLMSQKYLICPPPPPPPSFLTSLHSILPPSSPSPQSFHTPPPFSTANPPPSVPISLNHKVNHNMDLPLPPPQIVSMCVLYEPLPAKIHTHFIHPDPLLEQLQASAS